MRRGSKCHPRDMKRRKNKLDSTLTIGASTIWRGQSDCKLGKKHKDDQRKDHNKANPAVVASAATTINPR